MNVYLIQPNYRTGFKKHQIPWLPYSVGTCWSYAITDKQIADNFKLKEIIYVRENTDSIIERADSNGVYLFSNYIWNWTYNKTLANKLKNTYPDSTVIFGGPGVPNDESLRKDINQVDTFIHGMGEQALMNLLKNKLNGIKNPKNITVPMKSLDDIPSPYTTGLFDNIMELEDMGMRATLETNRGCPFPCTFCDWGSVAYRKLLKFPIEKIKGEIKWFSDNKIKTLNIADANVGVFAKRDEEWLMELVKYQKETGYPSAADAAWYKNSSERIMQLAKKTQEIGNNKSYTISMQSMNPKTLKEIKRQNLTIPEINNILTKANKLGIRSFSEMILGLPYETKNTWIDGFTKILEAGQHSHLEAWFCQILPNSELGSPESIAKHEIKTIQLNDYIGAVDRLDEINEEYSIVYSTKYMNFKDLIDSYMFSWLIINFHINGWTQIYSRFKRKYNNESFKEFYLKLLENIKSDSGIAGREYKRVHDIVKTYLTEGRINRNKFDFWVPAHSILYDSIKYLFMKDNELKSFLENLFVIDNKELQYNVIKLQNYFNTTPYKEYPTQIILDYNIAEYVTHDEELKQKKTTYDLCLPDIKYLQNIHKEKKLDEWYSMLFYRNKQGWGKSVIKNNSTIVLR
jgi:putative methyltransferase